MFYLYVQFILLLANYVFCFPFAIVFIIIEIFFVFFLHKKKNNKCSFCHLKKLFQRHRFAISFNFFCAIIRRCCRRRRRPHHSFIEFFCLLFCFVVLSHSLEYTRITLNLPTFVISNIWKKKKTFFVISTNEKWDR